MSKYRNALPQLEGGLFLTDGGLETTLVFHQGLDLPHFASFPLMEDAEGLSRLRTYYEDYIAIAKAAGAGFVLESVSWRANLDWGQKLGYGPATLAEANRQSIVMMEALRDAHGAHSCRVCFFRFRKSLLKSIHQAHIQLVINSIPASYKIIWWAVIQHILIV